MDLFFSQKFVEHLIFYCFSPQHRGSKISWTAEKITFLPVLNQLYTSFMDIADSYPEWPAE